MALKLSVAVRDARLDALETAIGADPRIVIYTGGAPNTCADAATGSVLVTITPSNTDWLSASSGGTKSKNGTWSQAAAGNGTAGYFRITNTGGTVAHIQGTCGTSNADMILDNTVIAAGQVVTVTSFSLNEAAHA